MGGKSFKKGEDVEWTSHGQNVKGIVAEKITKDTKTGGLRCGRRRKTPSIGSRAERPAPTLCTNQSRFGATK